MLTHPELALFLAVGVGHAIGRVRLGALRLNAVIGVLLAGVAVGQIGIEAPSALGTADGPWVARRSRTLAIAVREWPYL